MKLSKMKYVWAVGLLLFSFHGYAQNQASQNDSTVNAIKIKNLKSRKAALQKQIAVEDKKRNEVIEGVSPETLERRNERQDSLGADNTTTQIVQQYNSLVQSNHQDTTQVAVPNKPTPPAKPTKPSKPSKPIKPTKKK